MIHSRLSTKAQTTVPRAVRAALGLREGDTLAYRIAGDTVILTRAPLDTTADDAGNDTPNNTGDDPFATFTEWADDADRAYDALNRV